ncbi:PREDICTED: RPII140-upstream gene protein [Papilio xuthus]|uniref:Complex I assembly factor TIMMDC1, mitochondrial n=1 Tax=Papilio xuthus TaxID=66420 RepID=A0A194PZ18_PAPXU|nr:PREDICTED: RPII140-upstream gene protein [Papilio xuthus]KPI97994.1 RPII140-upstream gene protein [Papilio xuthus]
MIRTAIRLTPTFAFPFFEKRNVNDCDKLHTPEPHTTKTGLERVKKMFQRDEFGEVSVELHNVVQATMSGAFIGACFGGFLQSREAYVKFIERNQATAFTSTMQAKKQLQDYVTIGFAKGAVHWGWRLGLFTGCFSLFTTMIAVYRGESSLIDYIMAGALTGGVYKANLGVAATIVGATLGGVLSAFGGLLILNILKITGVSMDDLRRVLYKIKLAREEQYNQVLEKSATEKHDNLTRHHDKLITEKGETKIEEIS